MCCDAAGMKGSTSSSRQIIMPVEEGAHGAAQRPSLHGTAERRKKGLQAVQIHFRAAALLHRLLVTERLTGAAEEHITTGGLEFNHLVKLA